MQLSARLECEDLLTPSQPSMLYDMKTVRKFTAEIDGIDIRLNEYSLPKEILERNVSEQEVIIKAMAGSVKQLERKVISLHKEISLLQKTIEEVFGSSGKEKTVAKRRIEKVLKSVPTRFVGW